MTDDLAISRFGQFYAFLGVLPDIVVSLFRKFVNCLLYYYGTSIDGVENSYLYCRTKLVTLIGRLERKRAAAGLAAKVRRQAIAARIESAMVFITVFVVRAWKYYSPYLSRLVVRGLSAMWVLFFAVLIGKMFIPAHLWLAFLLACLLWWLVRGE